LAAVCRDGLPYKLISEVLPQVQIEVNRILSQMVEFSVVLEVDGKNVNGKIVYDEHRSWPIELASGMEKFVTGLAIRVALMSVSSLPKTNFLIIDEGLGALDADNLSSLFMLFDVLRAQFDFILLISHLDVVRDVSDNLIEIKRDDGYSQVLYS
jgi:DNA repair exonuclease SbcCD ATPase subunit